MGALVRTVAPILEPVSPLDVLYQARVDADTTEIGIVNDYAIAAREWVEDYTERSLMLQTWTQTLDGGFSAMIQLRRGPLLPAGTLTIEYVDTDGATQTLGSSVYQIDRNSQPPRIITAHGESWPTVRAQLASVTVTYQAGYGATSAAVPQSIRNAITMLGGYWFDQRFPVSQNTRLFEIPWGVKGLLDRYRDPWYRAA